MFLVGVIFSSMSFFLTYEDLKLKVDSFALDGSAGFFSSAFFERVVSNLTIVGIILTISSLLFFRFKREVKIKISLFFVGLKLLLKTLFDDFITEFKKESQIHVCTVAIIFFITIIIRIYFLFSPIHYDEAFMFSHYYVKPFYIILTYFADPGNHLVHTVLTRLAYLILGSSSWALRMPSFLAGILLVPVSYLFARIFYNKHVALLTASLVAVSAPLINYSTFARGHIFIPFYFLVLLILGSYVLKSNKLNSGWILIGIVSSIGFSTVLSMIYPFGVVISWLFLQIIINKKWALLIKPMYTMISCVILTAIFFTPIITFNGFDMLNNGFVKTQSIGFLKIIIKNAIYSTFNQWIESIPTIILFLLIVGFFLSFFYKKRQTYLLVMSLLIGILPILILQRGGHNIYPKIWIFLLPLFLTLCSSGIFYMTEKLSNLLIVKKKSRLFIVLSILFMLLVGFNIVYSNKLVSFDENAKLFEAEEIVSYLKEELSPTDRVLGTFISYGILEYFFIIDNISINNLINNPNKAKRLFVIVNKIRNESFEKSIFLDNYGLGYSAKSIGENLKNRHHEIKKIKEFKYSEIYEIDVSN